MAKRTNGEGTIYQREDGLWIGELTLGYIEVDGKKKRQKKRLTSANRETLLKLMNDERYKINRNMLTVKNDYTVSEWVLFWLENYKLNIIKRKTYDNYEYAYRCHIRSALGDIRLDKLKPEAIQLLYKNLLGKNLSTSTIKKVHITLNQALEQALKNGLIYINPCKATTLPKSTTKQAVAMSAAEQDIFLNKCENTTAHNFFVFLLNTGLRGGEAIALSWNDIDFDSKQISINKTVSVIKNRNDTTSNVKNITVIDTTKTESSTRIIPMNKNAERILLAQKNIPSNEFYVFSSKSGNILSHRNLSRSFTRLLSKANLPNAFSLHTLRHSFATRLLEKGANAKVVSDILGHSSITVTMNIYSHVMPDLKNSVMSLLD